MSRMVSQKRKKLRPYGGIEMCIIIIIIGEATDESEIEELVPE